MIWMLYLVTLLFLVILFLLGMRMRDRMAEKSAWFELTKSSGDADGIYDPEIVSSLPEPARRYFNYMIQPGTPLRRVLEINMKGELGLGSKESPNYRTMRARQILSPPFGFVWKVKTGAIVGSDGATPTTSWTRFWLLGIIPIVRAKGLDHRRSAFGRVIVEAAVWSPASLLPAQHVIWEPIDGKSARATVRLGKLSQSVDVSVDEAGRPNTVIISAGPTRILRSYSGHSHSAVISQSLNCSKDTGLQHTSRLAIILVRMTIIRFSRPKSQIFASLRSQHYEPYRYHRHCARSKIGLNVALPDLRD